MTPLPVQLTLRTLMRRHIQYLKTVSVLAALCGALTATAVLFAGPPRGEGPVHESVILLRNGEIIRGDVTRIDDRYRVVVPSGEITVRQSDVQCCSPDIEGIYCYRLKLISQDSVQDHLELAQWCQRVGLVEQAADQLSRAKALDANHPLIPLLNADCKWPLRLPIPRTLPERPCPSAQPPMNWISWCGECLRGPSKLSHKRSSRY